jgi:hypothetical protein
MITVSTTYRHIPANESRLAILYSSVAFRSSRRVAASTTTPAIAADAPHTHATNASIGRNGRSCQTNQIARQKRTRPPNPPPAVAESPEPYVGQVCEPVLDQVEVGICVCEFSSCRLAASLCSLAQMPR